MSPETQLLALGIYGLFCCFCPLSVLAISELNAWRSERLRQTGQHTLDTFDHQVLHLAE